MAEARDDSAVEGKRRRAKRVCLQPKYMCVKDELDLTLPVAVRQQFQELFYDFDSSNSQLDSSAEDGHSQGRKAWRMFFGKNDPHGFLNGLGIDLDNPTVRDAVAFDVVKLDDSSVSNDSIYASREHVSYSPYEYERFILNRNFRLNMASLNPDWSRITYGNSHGNDDDGNPPILRTKRTVDRMFQGVVFSDSILQFFDRLFNAGFKKDGLDEDAMKEVYVPFTNANDVKMDVALIPNTHPDFRPIVPRAYYDKAYRKYRKRLKKHGIRFISTFALVDPEKDKNHTGEILVKVQRKFKDSEHPYGYIVVKIGMSDGKFHPIEDGVLVRAWLSSMNEIVCVCQDDVFRGCHASQDSASVGEWKQHIVDEVKMVHSTTSSHYSVFRQRIPDYDLKQVRHYIQFKNRLEGMELNLEWLKRVTYQKEVQASDAFAHQTMAISRLFDEFTKKQRIMEIVKQYYALVQEWDDIVQRLFILNEMRDGKEHELGLLREEYRHLGPNRLQEKIDLGQKIDSLKMEIDKSLVAAISNLEDRKAGINQEIDALNLRIGYIQDGETWSDSSLSSLGRIWKEKFEGRDKDGFLRKINERKENAKNRYGETQVDSTELSSISDGYNADISTLESTAIGILDVEIDSSTGHVVSRGGTMEQQRQDGDASEPSIYALDRIDTTRLHRLVLMSEKWRNICYALGYEVNQLKKMLVSCEDATIKVRRLVRNFKDRMEQTEADIWDENHNLKEGFSFKGVSTSGLKDMILLHDWHAANAGGKTFSEMGFESEADFLKFRERCNRISYNLRKNQYVQGLAVKKDRISRLMMDLQDRMEDKDVLRYHDRYGLDAVKLQQESKNQADGDDESTSTSSSTKEATMQPSSPNMEHLERVRSELQPTLNEIHRMEKQMMELRNRINYLSHVASTQKDVVARNSLLIQKIENENRIAELRDKVKRLKRSHAKDMKELERAMKEVDGDDSRSKIDEEI